MTKHQSTPNLHSKIVILYGGFTCRSGGAYNHSVALSAALNSLGHSSKIFTLDALPFALKFIPHIVFSTSYLLYPPASFVLKGLAVSILFRIYFFFSGTSFDAIVFEDLYIAWQSKLPFIIIVHALWSDNLESYPLNVRHAAKLKNYEARLLSFYSQKCFTVSNEYSCFLSNEHFPALAVNALPVIPLGLDIKYISSFSNPQSQLCHPFSMVFTGLFCERKNLFFLLDIYRYLRSVDSRFELTLIGDGPLLPSLTSYALQHSLPLTLPGRLSGSQLYSRIAAHAIFLTASTKESFSFSLLEAKILGLSTYAHSSLEVPSEFIDFPVSSWDVSDWANAVLLSICSTTPKRVDFDRYSSKQMALSTLAAANVI